MSYQVSDGLSEMTRIFDEYISGSRVAVESDVRALRRVTKLLADAALDLEHEVSRLRWNEQARKERETAIVLELVKEPGSNIRLFPIIPRPFSDHRGAV
jgi:hypothetical protein